MGILMVSPATLAEMQPGKPISGFGLRPFFGARSVISLLFMSSPEYPLDTVEQRVSYGVALNMGANLARQGLEIDLGSFVVGLQDGLANLKPRVSEQDLKAAFETAQERMEAVAAEKSSKQAGAGRAFLEQNKARVGVTTTKSGLQYEVLRAGSGTRPTKDKTVEVHYHGTLVDGTVFDSSVDRGETISFSVTGVIAGWVEALQLMQVGAKWRLFIPSNLAYGDRGQGPIPPGSTLIFEVELVGIRD
jgi:FKBP-type peptidyl-prolyl cis-trans isomerase FklB